MSPATMLLDVRLTTPRLVLRSPQTRDVAGMVRGLDDFAVSRMLARVPHPYGLADGQAWVVQARRGMANGGGDVALVVEHDGEVAGGIGLHAEKDGPTLGYWLARPYWGRGLATEAVREFTQFAFAELGIRRISSGVFADNGASLRVQEKVGFRRIGLSRMASLARRTEVEHIDTILTPALFRDALP